MSDAIVKPHPYSVDLAKPVKKTYLDTLLVTQDDKANRFDISLYRDKEPLTLPSGAAVSAYFIRYSDNATIHIDGIASGNVASVTLRELCYKKSGQFALIIKVLNGGVISTVFYGEGTILASSTDTIVDEENVVPSLEDLLNQIAVMEAATANANTAAEAAGAWANASAVAVTVGENESAAVNVSEDASGNKKMTFSIPRGKTGAKGDKGDPGTIENVTITSINGLEEALDAKLNSDASAADSKLLEGKGGAYYLQPVNLLDNSNFANPVNQLGKTNYANGKEYTIDRWKADSQSMTVSVNTNCVSVTNGLSAGRASFVQVLQKSYTGKTLTVAICDNDTGNVYCASAQVPSATTETQYIAPADFNGHTARLMLPSDGMLCAQLMVANGGTANIRWFALYEGEYAADNLPPYVPKPYVTELLTCQQYYFKLDRYVRYPLSRFSTSEIDFIVPIPVKMRDTPNLNPSLAGTFNLMYNADATKAASALDGFSVGVARSGQNAIAVRFTKASHGLSAAGNIYMEVSSDAAFDFNIGVSGAVSGSGSES